MSPDTLNESPSSADPHSVNRPSSVESDSTHEISPSCVWPVTDRASPADIRESVVSGLCMHVMPSTDTLDPIVLDPAIDMSDPNLVNPPTDRSPANPALPLISACPDTATSPADDKRDPNDAASLADIVLPKLPAPAALNSPATFASAVMAITPLMTAS